MKALPVIALVLLALAGCTAETKKAPEAKPERPPLPVLKVGEPAAIDLLGDGRATVTVAAAELSKLDGTSDRLVVTIDILLNKAGKPITGGPENFRFRDKDSGMYQAQIDDKSFPPQLASISLTTTGQSAHGRLYFDVPAGNAEGGHIQLMTGALVHAVWTL